MVMHVRRAALAVACGHRLGGPWTRPSAAPHGPHHAAPTPYEANTGYSRVARRPVARALVVWCFRTRLTFYFGLTARTARLPYRARYR